MRRSPTCRACHQSKEEGAERLIATPASHLPCCAQNGMKWLENAYRDKARCWVGFNEPLSHRLTAAADIVVMPSRFEPCGLNQVGRSARSAGGGRGCALGATGLGTGLWGRRLLALSEAGSAVVVRHAKPFCATDATLGRHVAVSHVPQLYAMRYGAVPVAHKTGGLKDTVIDYDPWHTDETKRGTGWTYTSCDASVSRGWRGQSSPGRSVARARVCPSCRFAAPLRRRGLGRSRSVVCCYVALGRSRQLFLTRFVLPPCCARAAQGLVWALGTALHTYYNFKPEFESLQRRGMQRDSSWDLAAQQY